MSTVHRSAAEPAPPKPAAPAHTLEAAFDGKFTVTYRTSDGQESAFRVLPEMGRLIAAAPELLAACEALVSSADSAAFQPGELPTVDLARTAIAKARGESK